MWGLEPVYRSMRELAGFVLARSSLTVDLVGSTLCSTIGMTLFTLSAYHLSLFNYLLVGNLFLFSAVNLVVLAVVLAGIDRRLQRVDRALRFRLGEPDAKMLVVRWSRIHYFQWLALPLMALVPHLNPWWLVVMTASSYTGIVLAAGWFSWHLARTAKQFPRGTGRLNPAALDRRLQADAYVKGRYGAFASQGLFKQRIHGELRNTIQVERAEVLLQLPEPAQAVNVQVGVAGLSGKSPAEGEVAVRFDQTTVLKKPLGMLPTGWHDFSNLQDGTPTLTVSQIRLSKTGKDPVYCSVHIAKPVPDQKNVIVIVIDALRKDAVGLSNGRPDATPSIDHFFGPYTRYERAYTQAEWTLPAFASMATSLYPSHHRILNPQYDQARVLPPDVETLPEALQRHGYYTFAYLSHVRASHLYDHHRGYQQFIFPDDRPTHQEITCKALEVLHTHPRENKFLFLHYFDLHSPIKFSSPICWDGATLMTRSDADILQHAEAGLKTEQDAFFTTVYANKLRELDLFLDVLFSSIERTPLRDTTAIILTADHGMNLPADGVEGWAGKQFSEQRLCVPFLLRCPWKPETRGKVFHGLVESSVDLYPTVVELTGIHATASPYARSVLPDAAGRFAGKECAITEMMFRGQYKCRVLDQHYEYVRKFHWGSGALDETLHPVTSPTSVDAAEAAREALLEQFRRVTIERDLFQPGADVAAYYEVQQGAVR